MVVDNFANCVESKGRMAESLIRAQQIAGREIFFYPCDLLDKNELSEVFKKVGTLRVACDEVRLVSTRRKLKV